ncbi:MAG: hypothetical protein AAGI12_10030 [Pseudomonadota bacterium]
MATSKVSGGQITASATASPAIGTGAGSGTDTRTYAANKTHQQNRETDDLLLLATDRFCVQGNYNRLTQEQYCEAFGLLYEQAGIGSKQIIARSLAFQPFAPRSIIYRLALEPLGISRAVLQESTVLGQLDLLRLLETRGTEIGPVIASRAGLGPTLVRRLREFRDQCIDAALAQNASLAQGNALGAEPIFNLVGGESAGAVTKAEQAATPVEPSLEQMTAPVDTTAQTWLAGLQSEIDQAPTDVIEPELVANLSTEDLETESALPVLSDAQKALMQAAARGGRLEPVQVVASPGADAAANDGPKPEVQPDTTVPENVAATKNDAESFAIALQKAASRGNRQAMVQLIQSFFGLSLETCHQIFEDGDGDTLSVLLKSADVDAAAANRISLLVFPAIGLSVHNASRSIRYYSQLEQQACLEAVGQWPKAVRRLEEATGNKTPQHAPYLADTDKAVRRDQRSRTQPAEHQPADLQQTG